jgi:hypothetical protein
VRWEANLFGIAKRLAERRRRSALWRISLSDRSRTPLAEERGVTPIPLRLSDLEVLRELGEAKLADEYLAVWEEWKAKHPALRAPVQGAGYLRRIVLFLLAITLLGGGAYLLLSRVECEFGVAPLRCDPIPVRMLVMVAFMIFLGAYVLWADFLMPWLSKALAPRQ